MHKSYLFLLILLLIIVTGCKREKQQIKTTTEHKDTETTIEKELTRNPITTTTEEFIFTYHRNEIYQYLKSIQLPNGLLSTDGEYGIVSLYDNALAAILFTYNGDYENAEKIFDFFNQHIPDELTDGPGGFSQFRDVAGIPLNKKPHRWLGDNAWLLIALNIYQDQTGSHQYDTLTNELTTWIRSLQNEDGSVFGGYDESNQKFPIVTEGMLDAFNAIPGYDDFHRGILKYIKNNRYDESKHVLLATKTPPYQNALDLHSWGYLILEDYPKTLLDQADIYKMNQTTYTGQTVTGYSFDIDKDSIWLEGTMEMAVAYDTFQNETAEFLINQVSSTYIPLSDYLGGIPYATHLGTGYGKQLLWSGIDNQPAISASVWYLFAIDGYNPLALGYEKNIPNEDKFYIE